ncbi:hypothetical protein ACHAWX_000281 [Stephanocyclus meneghinianus]
MLYYGASNAPSSNIDAAKIFAGGLSWQTTQETLRYHCEQYGEVSSVEVMSDRNTGDPRGVALVVFKSNHTVELILSLWPHEIVEIVQSLSIASPSIHGTNVSTWDSLNLIFQHNSFINCTTFLLCLQITGSKHSNRSPITPIHQTRKTFSWYLALSPAIVMMDMMAHWSRGFGIVTFENGSNGDQKAFEAQLIKMFDKMD